jgi:hypothetical protein
MILEALLGRQAGHPDVVAGLAVTARVAQIHNIDGVMVGAFPPRHPARIPCAPEREKVRAIRAGLPSQRYCAGRRLLL